MNAAGRFFVRVGQAGRAAEAHRDPYTGYLFPLPVIMAAEGVLADDARHLARATDPDTSKRAADKAQSFIATQNARIFGWIKDHPQGQTYREIAAGVRMEPAAVGRRLKGLRETAGVYADGERDGMQLWKAR